MDELSVDKGNKLPARLYKILLFGGYDRILHGQSDLVDLLGDRAGCLVVLSYLSDDLAVYGNLRIANNAQKVIEGRQEVFLMFRKQNRQPEVQFML